MRDYGKVSPLFWIGETGKRLRGCPEAQVVALYLVTNPHANMLGLYYISLPTLIHETGLGEQGASKGLRRAIEAGFCSYDEASEYVWVHEMARYQIGDELTANDKRVPGIMRELLSIAKIAKCPFLRAFFERYREPFKIGALALPEAPSMVLGSPIEAPSMPHRSQEQEQEQEQENNIAPRGGASIESIDTSSEPEARPPVTRASKPKRRETWLTPFCEAWKARTGGELIVDQALKPLSSVRREYGEERALAGWRKYLATTEAKWLSPAKFASKAGVWIGTSAATPASEVGKSYPYAGFGSREVWECPTCGDAHDCPPEQYHQEAQREAR